MRGTPIERTRKAKPTWAVATVLMADRGMLNVDGCDVLPSLFSEVELHFPELFERKRHHVLGSRAKTRPRQLSSTVSSPSLLTTPSSPEPLTSLLARSPELNSQ